MSGTDTVDPTRRSQRAGTPLEAAKAPVSRGAITVVGVLLALSVMALGVVGLQAALAAAGLTSSAPWLTSAIESMDGLRPVAWMLPVGVVLVLLGLWLLVTALRPRPRTGLALDARTGVFLRPRDLARLAEDAAEDVDGVASVHARATRSKVALTIGSTGDAATSEAVKGAVTERLAAVRKAPTVSVKTKEITP